MPIGPETAFICYSRDDSQFVRQLAVDLKKAGAQVWMDKLDIRAGQVWAIAVESAMKASGRMLVILSPNSVSSSQVRAEFTYALNNKKEVIPVLHRECEIPYLLQPYQNADFTADYEEGVKTLLEALGVAEQAAAASAAVASSVTAAARREQASSPLMEAAQKLAAEEKAQQLKLEQEREAAGEKLRQEELERQRQAAEQARLEEERSLAAERVQREEQERKAAEEKVRQEELARQRQAAEQARLEEERSLAAERVQREEQERKAAEEKVRQEELARQRQAVEREVPPGEDGPGGEAGRASGDGSDENDELYQDAVRIVLEYGKASTSLLQRRLRIGYGRAAHLIDLMERNGLVGAADGPKPREVRKTPEQVTSVPAPSLTKALSGFVPVWIVGGLVVLGLVIWLMSRKPQQQASQTPASVEQTTPSQSASPPLVNQASTDSKPAESSPTNSDALPPGLDASMADTYRKALAGDSGAMATLGLAYSNGSGAPKDDNKAFYWDRKAADAGNPQGMVNLGVDYRDGIGVTKSFKEAVKWFRKAADAGAARGMNNIGDMYRDGNGVSKNYGEALKWYRKAADAGDEWGMVNLGYLYENGYGVDKDSQQAISFYRKAASLGNQYAKDQLRRLGETP